MGSKREAGNKCGTAQNSGDLWGRGKGLWKKETQKRDIFWGDSKLWFLDLGSYQDYPARQGGQRGLQKGWEGQIYLPEDYFGQMENGIGTGTIRPNLNKKLHGHVHGSTIHNCPKVGRTHMSINWRTERWNGTVTHTTEHYSDVKKEWRGGTCCNVDEGQKLHLF